MPPHQTPGKRRRLSAGTSGKLEKLLKAHKVTASFYGHMHSFHKGYFAGAPFYVCPPSGQGRDYGYLNCTVSGGSISVKEIKVPWQGSRVTVFPDYEIFKLSQIISSSAYICIVSAIALAGIILLIAGFAVRPE